MAAAARVKDVAAEPKVNLSESQREDFEKLLEILPDRNPNDIKLSLAKFKDDPRRRERVGIELLEQLADSNSEEHVNGEIVNASGEHIQSLVQMFPNKSKDEIQTVLSQFDGHEDKVTRAIDALMNETVALMNETVEITSPAGDTNNVNDILEYVQEVVKLFPNENPNVIYNKFERDQNEGKTLKDTKKRLISELTPPVDNTILPPEPEAEEAAGPSGLSNVFAGIDAFLSEEQRSSLANICQIFADVDPKWVVTKLTQEGVTSDELVQRMFSEPGSYNKLKTRQARELTERRRDNMLDLDKFSVPQFLQVFPHPEAHFIEQTSVKSHLYADHALIALTNDFPIIRLDYIRKTLITHKNHLYPAYKHLKDLVAKFEPEKDDKIAGPARKKARRILPKEFLKKIRNVEMPWPENIDEAFFKELQFARWHNVVAQYQNAIREEKERRLKEARENGTLMECQCCYMDDCIPDDMIYCNQKHPFCQPCVVQMVEAKLGEGHHKIDCLSGDCDQCYSASVLRHILNANVFNRLIRNMQQHELREANMENLCACPFCDFAMIIDNETEKLFTCLNPDCLKVSCRECKEENHIPLRCDEVEKGDEVKMRTYIEEKCAEAMIRKCPNCQKPIIKETGCNKMTCPCGTYFCYVCNKALDRGNPYAHYSDMGQANQNGVEKLCAATTSMANVHEQVALAAGEEARKKYLQDHPHMKDKKHVAIKSLVDSAKAARVSDEEDFDSSDDDGFIDDHDDVHNSSDSFMEYDDDDYYEDDYDDAFLY